LKKQGLGQFGSKLKNFADRNFRHQRKLKRYESDFDTMIYAENFQRTFIDAHEALCKYVCEEVVKSFLFYFQIFFLAVIQKN
jgi:hypothetical protein